MARSIPPAEEKIGKKIDFVAAELGDALKPLGFRRQGRRFWREAPEAGEVVFHLLDRDEVEFPFERMTLFEGMEQMPELLCDPKSLRDAYLAEIEGFAETIRKGCLGQRIDYVRVVNSMPLDVVLTSYLSARSARAKRRK